MFTNRSFYLLIIVALLVVTACAPQVASTPISSTATLAPTLMPTATLFEGRLLFSRFDESAKKFIGMYIAQTDGSAEINIPLPWTEGGGQWSNSGTEIAVATLLDDGRIGTAIIAIDGTVLRVLSIPDPTLNLPCTIWSRDDTRLACEGWDDTNPSRNGIYTVLASDGTDVQRLTTPPAGQEDCPSDFSPDGQFIFKRSTGYEVPGPLMLVDANGGEPRILYDGHVDDCGRFSPNGRFVLTATNGSLMVIDLNGKVVHEISIDGHVAFGGVWAPNGTRIAFSMTTPGVYSSDIYTSLLDGSDLKRVTNTPANEIDIDWKVLSE